MATIISLADTMEFQTMAKDEFDAHIEQHLTYTQSLKAPKFFKISLNDLASGRRFTLSDLYEE